MLGVSDKTELLGAQQLPTGGTDSQTDYKSFDQGAAHTTYPHTYHPSSDAGELQGFARALGASLNGDRAEAGFSPRTNSMVAKMSHERKENFMERASYLALERGPDALFSMSKTLFFVQELELAAIENMDEFCSTAVQTHERDPDDGSSLFQTALAILKAFVGPATLYLPHAFAQGGLLFSVPCLLFSFCFCSFGATCLVQCWRVYGGSYGTIAKKAFGRPGLIAVRTSLILSQCGLCVTYFIFVSHNISALLQRYLHIQVDTVWLVIAQACIQVPLVFVPQLKYFALTNLCADVLILFGLVVLMSYSSQALRTNGVHFKDKVIPLFNDQGFASTFGQCVLCFEGLALTLPLQCAAKPRSQDSFLLLFVCTIGCVTLFWVGFATLNWFAIGNTVQTVLMLSLPPDGYIAAVQAAYCAAVVFTFPLQLFPAITILNRGATKIGMFKTRSAR
jgi:proton-coupled amino acid transporter